jgi:protein SCO1
VQYLPRCYRTCVCCSSLSIPSTIRSELQALAHDRQIDTTRWMLARTHAATVRKIAAVLNVQYRQLPDGSYNHSSIVSLLTEQGVIARQSSMLGKADPELVEALRR